MKQPTSTLPRMSGSRYEPKVGDTITVELPDERTRAEVIKVISDTAVLARLATFTTAKGSHNYRKDDVIPCRFQKLGMGVPGWRVVSEREMDEAQVAQKPKGKKVRG